MSADKRAAYQTLHQCLVRVAQLMSPVAPFYADRLYRDLVAGGDQATSVHLSLLPAADESLIDVDFGGADELRPAPEFPHAIPP